MCIRDRFTGTQAVSKSAPIRDKIDAFMGSAPPEALRLAAITFLARISCQLRRAFFRFLWVTAANIAITRRPLNALFDRNAWLNGVEHIVIRLFLHEVESLLADSATLAAHKDMAIIILYLAPWPLVDNGLVLLKALTLLALIGQVSR